MRSSSLILLSTLLCAGCEPAPHANSPPVADKSATPEHPAKDASPIRQPLLPGLEKIAHAPLTKALIQAIGDHGPDYTPRTKHLGQDGSPLYVNRLIRQKSPYLLQHAHNPVNWYPWGDEAFDHARRLGRPVFLSVGYSTCHWCHVMEEESFEDLEIAAMLNARFIAIKVDREERPDLDDVYMSAVTLLTGRGGWPMTVVMTPEKAPFFGGTYIPPRDGVRGASKGLLTLLKELADGYDAAPQEVIAKAKSVSARMQQLAQPDPGTHVPGPGTIPAMVEQFRGRFDPVHGGFGGAPKFPTPVNLEFLLRAHAFDPQDTGASHMVTHTLLQMAHAGIFDHVGGGFHRYSVDARWQVPHFEKMLYDNAQLLKLYALTYQLTKDPMLRLTAGRTADYLLGQMRDAKTGGFYSATDADSLNLAGEREEGVYFVWTTKDLQDTLSPEDFGTLKACYELPEGGNFEGKIILERKTTCPVERDLSTLHATLERTRDQRPRPGLDDKILTSWNALAISGLAWAGFVLERPEWIKAAEHTAGFLLTKMRSPQGSLYRSWRAGEVTVKTAFLDDHVFLVAALLDLFEVTGKATWFDQALVLQNLADREFRDQKDGLYTMTAASQDALLTQNKPTYDGAQPSGNGVAAMNLLRLAHFTGEEAWQTKAGQTLKSLSSQLGGGMGATLCALTFLHTASKEVVLAAPDRTTLASSELLKVFRDHYLPQHTLILRLDEDPEIDHSVPITRAKRSLGGKVRAFVCEQGRCELPTTDPDVFAAQLLLTTSAPSTPAK